MRWRGSAKLAVSLASVLLLSGCNYLSDWSNQHHMRLYERFRLVAHHDLSDGHPQEAIANVKKALAELAMAKPNDQLAMQSSLLELGGMYLAENLPKEALDCYDRIAVESSADAEGGARQSNGLAAQRAAGKGFCFLKMNEIDKAVRELEQALQLYKDKSTRQKTVIFPIDLCPSCTQWALEQCARKQRNPQEPIEFKMLDNMPLPCECVTTRSIISGTNPPGLPLEITADGAADKSNKTSSGTVSGTSQQTKDDADLQYSWSTLIQAGKQSARDKQDEKAERFFKSAISLLRKNNDKGVRLLESLQTLSFFYLMRSRGAEAMPYLKEEIDLQRERFGNNDVALIAPLCRYGAATMRQGKLDIADKSLTESLQLSDRILKDSAEVCAIIHSNLAELRALQMRNSEAEVQAKKAIQIFEKLTPLNKQRLGSTYFTLTRVYIDQNKLVEAQAPMKETLKLIDLNDTAPNLKFHILLTQANLALRLKKIGEAKQAIKDARAQVNKIKSRPKFPAGRILPLEPQLIQLETLVGAEK